MKAENRRVAVVRKNAQDVLKRALEQAAHTGVTSLEALQLISDIYGLPPMKLAYWTGEITVVNSREDSIYQEQNKEKHLL